MNWHISELEHGYITRFLITEPRMEEVTGEPVAITEESNVWIGSTAAASHENPLKADFLEKAVGNGIAAPVFTDAQPEGSAVLMGDTVSVRYRAPFGDPVIGASLFTPTPHWLSVAAYIVLNAEKEGDYRFLLTVEGGMSIFSDGKEIFSFRPYKRNQARETECILHLKKGDNILVVEADEFSERDTELSVTFLLESGPGTLLQKVPMGKRDTESIMKMERAMETLSFDRSTFTEGHVTATMENPFPGKTISVHMIGATEENEALGIRKEAIAVFSDGSSKADLGPVEEFPVGFLRMNVSVEIEGLAIRTVRTFENFPSSFQGDTATDIEDRRMEAWRFLSLYGEGNANRAMALLYMGGDKDEIERILRAQLDFINRRSDCSDFYISYFPFMIRHFGSSGLIRKETLDDMEKCLLSFRYWHDEPGDDAMWFWSENHALMFHVSELIVGEMFPDRIFSNSGMTGREKQRKAISMLRPWFETFFKDGFTEWNSPPYLPIDILGFASLYAQTENEEMRAYAKRALEYVFRLLAITSYEGIFSTTSGRTYLKELMGNYSNCPSFINWIGYGIGNESHAGKGSVPVLMSNYTPSPDNLRYHRISKGHALLWKSTHGYNGYADVTVYKTSGYLLSAANDFSPGRRGFQEDVLHAVLGAEAHVWITHPGEFALYGQARPSYWAGSGTLPRANQYRGFASAIWEVAAEHPVDFTHAYFPSYAFRSCRIEDGWAFGLTERGGMIAITAANGLEMTGTGPNSMRELTSPGKRNIWIIRCSDEWLEGSFEAFISRIRGTRLSYDMNALSYSFEDEEYGTIEAGWDRSLSISGKEEQYKGFTPEGTLWEIEPSIRGNSNEE